MTEDQKAIMASPGCLKFDERMMLYRLASEATKPIVEIGSFLGSSTLALALGGNQEVYSIDPHEDVEDSTCSGHFYGTMDRGTYLETIASVAYKVRPIFLRSSPELAAALQIRIGLLFIDGDHLHPHPTKDAEWFQPYVDGKIVLDDMNQPGPAQAGEYLEMLGFRRVEFTRKLGVFER